MELFKDIEMEVKVYKYNSEEQMKNHIIEMKNKGYKCKRQGEYNLSKESTVTSFLNQDNWFWVAEFSNEKIHKNDDYWHETEAYYF